MLLLNILHIACKKTKENSWNPDDPIGNADDYVGYGQDVNKAGGQLDYDHKLTIGDGSCGMDLTYTAKEIPVI